jgi:diadenosine tetraphosphate (Ap4A) HIT family hydrolase
MSSFILHPRLVADSVFVRDLGLCQLRLQNQKLVPWLVLVPRRPGLTEIFDLAGSEQIQLIQEISEVSRLVSSVFKPDKLNVAALGNLVPQLHVHVVARYHHDPAWPQPAWGRLPDAPYSEDELGAVLDRLKAAG